MSLFPLLCRIRHWGGRVMRRAFDVGLGRRICRFGRRQNNVKKMGDHWIMFSLDVRTRLGWKAGSLLGGKTYPAIPIDCGSFRDSFSASQYAGVTRSIPSRMPTKMSVGIKLSSSVLLATFKKLSSYTSAPSPVI